MSPTRRRKDFPPPPALHGAGGSLRDAGHAPVLALVALLAVVACAVPSPSACAAPPSTEGSEAPFLIARRSGTTRRVRESESRHPRTGEAPRPPDGSETSATSPATVSLFHSGGCALPRADALRTRLLALEPAAAELLSLEAWSTKETYTPGDRVRFQLRTSRRAYVTLFWISPDGSVFVALDAARVPADTDASVDAEAFIVPPVGRERWVALATLERAPFPCAGPPHAGLAWLTRATSRLHSVARWEVRSEAPGR